MATAAPHVKLLRQLASAKDDYLSGAFDISWDGAKATLYLIFGRPSHAVFDSDQAQIEGEAAIDALLAELPRTFAVSDWRRAMSPHETLSISIDELAGPFVRLAGSYADDPVSEESPEWWSADDSSPDLAFGLNDFPLLPGGRPLWAETSPENVNLAERLAELPPSILILTGAKLRAAAVVSGGDLIDAVWIDDEDQARGEAAGMAILGATKGTLAGYALDDPRVAEALTMLWRLPLAVSGIEMSWLDPASMLAAFRADGLDRVLVIDAPVRGIALFSRGGLVAVYSETQRSAVASPERLRSLLSQARGRLTVMERKPRPVGAAAAHASPSATDFFEVVVDDAPADVEPEADAAPAEAAEMHVEDESFATASEPAEAQGDAGAEADAEPEAVAGAEPVAAAEPSSATEVTAEPGDEGQVDAETGDDTQVAAEPGDGTHDAAEAGDDSHAAIETWTGEAPVADGAPDASEADTEAGTVTAETAADATLAGDGAQEHAAVHDADAPSSQEIESAETETANENAQAGISTDGSELPPPPPPDAEHAPPPSEADFAASAEHAPPAPDADTAAPVEDAPPATEADLAASIEHSPPPPAPDVAVEPERKPKRRWWAFGSSRKDKGGATPVPSPETIAAEAAAAHESADAATFAGWSVRQPNPETQPVWYRSRDHAEGADGSASGIEAPPPAAEAVSEAPAGETEGAAAAPTWSIVEPGSVTPRATSWPSTPSAPPAEEPSEAEASSDEQPENAATPGWSTRDILADSAGWYHRAEPAQPEGADSTAEDAPAAVADGEGAQDDAGAVAQADTDEGAHAQADESPHAYADDSTHVDADAAADAVADEAAYTGTGESTHANTSEETHANADAAVYTQTDETTHADTDAAAHMHADESANVDGDSAAYTHPDESTHLDADSAAFTHSDESTHVQTDAGAHAAPEESVPVDADAEAYAHMDESPHLDADESAPENSPNAPHTETVETSSEGDSDHAVAAEVDQSLAQWFHPPQVASADHDSAGTDDHEALDADAHDATAQHDDLAAFGEHEAVAQDEPAPEAAYDEHTESGEHEPEGAIDASPMAAAGDEPADETEHDPSAAVGQPHDFWAEFASPDPDAEPESGAAAEPEEQATASTEAAPADEPASADQRDVFTRRPSERTVAPWSWPLAESEPVPPASHQSTPAPVEAATDPESASGQSESDTDDWAPVFESANDQSFFQRDEPVGSQFVDFDEVRTELVQIGIVWLGETNAVPVTALLQKTRSTIDDFVATIDTIRGLHLEGQDPASVQAMAREMHQQAAERLCGA